MNTEQLLILREDKQGITTLTLNRPQQYNPLSLAALKALDTLLNDIANDMTVRVVIIAAQGKAFCAGHDLKEMRANQNRAFANTLFNLCSDVMLKIHRLPQPVIAKVQGIATAGGCQLVAACDLAIASDVAKFATSGINVGLFCGTPAVPISRTMSRKHAMAMLLTGEFIS